MNMVSMTRAGVGAKELEMSSSNCVWAEAKALIALPSPAGTIARFEVMAPSAAFNVETTGCG